MTHFSFGPSSLKQIHLPQYTHSFNSPQSLLFFKELPALGSSNFPHIVLQSGFDLLSMSSTVPIELLINLSETLMLSVSITLTPTKNFNFAETNVIRYRY